MSRQGTLGNAAFTLVEIIVVLAIVAAMAAVLAPLAFSYLQDARKTQAQNDANQIASAIGKFLRDTGLPPYKNNTSSSKIPAKESADFDCLYSAAGNDPATTTDATTGDSWTSGAGVQCQAGSTTRDSLENHLINDTPGGSSTKAYATTGKTAWKGPYLPSIPADPWGNHYLVNIGKADPGAGKAMWVISAGPNGQLETGSDATATSTISVVGDDIIARVK